MNTTENQQTAMEALEDATIQGYVTDNMEGAVDQAAYLAGTDIPVAVVGARGTGKMYVAKVIHRQSAHADGEVVVVDCRELRKRETAVTRVRRALERAGGTTLVFKSPHLMHADAQNKLARQLSTRTFTDGSAARYLPAANYVALFPDSIEQLLQEGSLTPRLASVFAGFPINVPPIRDRKQAVLRWARKILGQECSDRGREVRGFTPEAEKAMLSYAWPGNITEMRERIVAALAASDREWLTPVDLGIFECGASPPSDRADSTAFLARFAEPADPVEEYRASPFESLDTALGSLVSELASADEVLPIGQWLADEIVLAVRRRYPDDNRACAEFLLTRPRNLSRWLPQIEDREDERLASAAWLEPKRLVGVWIREIPPPDTSPLDVAEDLLLRHLEQLAGSQPLKRRAHILGVSVPTYQKRLQQRQGA